MLPLLQIRKGSKRYVRLSARAYICIRRILFFRHIFDYIVLRVKIHREDGLSGKFKIINSTPATTIHTRAIKVIISFGISARHRGERERENERKRCRICVYIERH